MPRINMSPKAIKAAVDDFVIAQNRAKRILSTAMHQQRLRIQQLEQYQQDLLGDDRLHAEQVRREAAAHRGEDSSNEVLTDFEGQSEGYTSRPASTSRSRKSQPTSRLIARPDVGPTEAPITAREIQCHATRTNWLWQDTTDKEHGKTHRCPHGNQ
jgi:hypothetical protein